MLIEKTFGSHLLLIKWREVSQRSVTSASDQAKTIAANKSLPISRHVSIVAMLNARIHNRPSIERRPGASLA